MTDPAHEPDTPGPETHGRQANGDASAPGQTNGQAAPDEDALSYALGNLNEDEDGDAAPGVVARPTKPKAILCPYCGHKQSQLVKQNRCDQCGGLFEPLSRKATQIAMGPWFLRDQRHPFRPGCSFQVILRLVEQNKVSATTVIRGPTTRQFWSIARNVPGLSHHLGYCHACRGHIEKSLDKCPLCEAEFGTPPHRNELGLLYPNEQAAEAAQRSLDRQLALVRGDDLVDIDAEGNPVERHPDPAQPPADPDPADTAAESQVDHPAVDGGELLDDVLGIQSAPTPPAPDPAPPPPAAPLIAPITYAGQPPATPAPSPPPPTPVPPREPEAAPLRPPHPNELSAVQPAKPWVVYLLIGLNVLVALGLILYFVMKFVRSDPQ